MRAPLRSAPIIRPSAFFVNMMSSPFECCCDERRFMPPSDESSLGAGEVKILICVKSKTEGAAKFCRSIKKNWKCLGFRVCRFRIFCGVRGEECGAEVHAGRGRNVRAKDERGPADASQRTLSGSVGISRPRGQDRAGLGRQSSSCTISGCSQTRMRGRSCRASSRRRCRDAARSPAPCRRSIRPCRA